jgi:hypothetical protein
MIVGIPLPSLFMEGFDMSLSHGGVYTFPCSRRLRGSMFCLFRFYGRGCAFSFSGDMILYFLFLFPFHILSQTNLSKFFFCNFF